MSAEPSAEQSLGRSLAIRIGIALIALVAVLGLVLSMGTDSGPEGEPAAAGRAPVPQPATGAPVQPDAVKEPPASAATADGGASVDQAAAPGEGAGAAHPAMPSAPQTQSASGASAAAQPATDRTAAQPSQPSSPGSPAAAPVAAAEPDSTRAAAAAPFAGLLPSPGAKPPRGPHLQAGVFLQAANAQSFKAKLEAQGLPVYVESRVHIGPFRDRKEAERVREKLNEMGLTTVLIAQ